MIKIGCKGKVVSGDVVNSWVTVEDDSDNAGGFLIHLSTAGIPPAGSDDWVEDYTALEQYFHKNNWVIDWSQSK